MKSRYLLYGILVLVSLGLAVIGVAQGAPPLQWVSLLLAALALIVVAVLVRRRKNLKRPHTR